MVVGLDVDTSIGIVVKVSFKQNLKVRAKVLPAWASLVWNVILWVWY
jgi:hypothetical protein